MGVGAVMIAVGCLMILSSPALRKEGVPDRFFAPVWRARAYLNPPGVALRVGGMLILLIGVVLLVEARF